MRIISRGTKGRDDYEELGFYNVEDFPYYKFDNRDRQRHGIVKEGRKKYWDFFMTFDIETTSVTNCNTKDFGFMYIWQACVDGVCVYGRRWDEFISLAAKLLEYLNDNTVSLVCYIHNLSFEFQFMRDYLKVESVFARDERNPIKVVSKFDSGHIEFRCSYFLTNMGLAQFTNKTRGVKHRKLSGEEFNYSVYRYPDTPLTDQEMWYCACDVLGLWEGINSKLEDEGDTLATIPLTSTGYVRRLYRDVCTKNREHMKMFHDSALDETMYKLCKEASRGAISGSSHLFTDETIENVHSRDIKSSYPFQMATKYFPIGKCYTFKTQIGSEKFEQLINEFCCIIVWKCKNLSLKKWSGIPYISKAKCRAIENGNCGNGKVYMADKIGMCCTEIDYKIIRDQYYFEDPELQDGVVYAWERGQLSKAFRETLMNLFQQKCELEGGDPYLYMKFKNKINSSFGMMMTDILSPEIVYDGDGLSPWHEEAITDYEKALHQYYGNKNSFLSYQHGVWVLAHGRDSLVEGMKACEPHLVQVDTDSCKYHAPSDPVDAIIWNRFEDINKHIIENAETYSVKPYAQVGNKKIYLGVWEEDGTYPKFRTLGAKKYCYEDDQKDLHITVAGMNKRTGAKWLEANGGIEAFRPGTIIPTPFSGRTSALYNDEPNITQKYVNGHRVELGSNIAIRNINYTLGVTSEWMNMILDGKIDPDEHMVSNGAWYD